MVAAGPDASNSCLPSQHPVVVSVPPLPSCTRGERCPITGEAGRLHQASDQSSVIVYAANKLVVCRNILDATQPLLPGAVSKLPVLVYRGHCSAAPVTAVAVSKSGSWVATGDERGGFRVWALDHPDHLCRYSCLSILSGPVRDIDWDGESKRIAVAGERAPTDGAGACAKALQWDTGVSIGGSLGMHFKGRASSCSFRPNRPYRIVTAGKDDSKVLLNAGPPFAKVPVVGDVPAETAHARGSVLHAVRYNHSGTAIVSVGSDRSICLYDGATLELQCQLQNAHGATIFDAAWSADDATVVTASGDGTCKLFACCSSSGGGDGKTEKNGSSHRLQLVEKMVWRPAEHQAGSTGADFAKVPIGGVQAGCAFVQGKTPVSVGFNGQISILKPNGSCETVTGHSAPVAACAVDWSNGAFYTGDTAGILCRWDATTVIPVRRLEPIANAADLMHVVHTGAVSGAAVARCGTGSTNGLLTVGWDDKLNISIAGAVQPNPVSLGAQPRAIAAGTSVACIVTVAGLLVVVNGKISGPMIAIPYEAQAVAVAADDSSVYVGGKDCKIYIYSTVHDADGGGGCSLSLKHTIENGHLKPVHCLALSNDGTKLASADERDVCVWDLSPNAASTATAGSEECYCVRPLVSRGKWCFHVQRVTALAWSPDDSVLASGGADDSVYLWSVARCRGSAAAAATRVHYAHAHRGGLVSLHFFPAAAAVAAADGGGGGLRLLSTGADSVVNVWDVNADVKAKFG